MEKNNKKNNNNNFKIITIDIQQIYTEELTLLNELPWSIIVIEYDSEGFIKNLKQIENKLCNLKHGCMYDGMYLFVLSCIDDIL